MCHTDCCYVDRQAEEFVNTFEDTYTLIEQRVGEASNVTSSSGGVVRILKCFPADWQVWTFILYIHVSAFFTFQIILIIVISMYCVNTSDFQWRRIKENYYFLTFL